MIDGLREVKNRLPGRGVHEMRLERLRIIQQRHRGGNGTAATKKKAHAMKAQMATAKQVSKCWPQVQNAPCDSAVEGRNMKVIRQGSAQDATQPSAAQTADSEISLSGGGRQLPGGLPILLSGIGAFVESLPRNGFAAGDFFLMNRMYKK